jgi:hypothetical protein
MAISFSFLTFHSRHTASLFPQKSIRQRPSAWKGRQINGKAGLSLKIEYEIK